jgi:hypothetical protein
MSTASTDTASNAPSHPRVASEAITRPNSIDQRTESHRERSSSTSGHGQSRPTEPHWEFVIDRATD